ncbi:GATA-type zinc finger protein 1 [Guaruba guarouba]
MEPLFLEGQSPDFSVLQRLLCLEPGPETGPGPGLEPEPGSCQDLPSVPGAAADTAAHGWEPEHREGPIGRDPGASRGSHREGPIWRDPGASGGSHREGSGSIGRVPSGGIREHREGPIGRVPSGGIREHREGPIGRVPSGGIREHGHANAPLRGKNLTGEGHRARLSPMGRSNGFAPPLQCPNSIPRGSSGVLEPPPAPWSPGEGLTFLQETVRLLPPPAPPMAPPAAPPEQRSAVPVPPRSPDALSLISLQCQRLAANGGTGRRKQAVPQRGAGPGDPRFRGVTLRMRLDLRSSSAEGCGLLITARGSRTPKWSSPEAGESSSEKNGPLGPGSKRCASCGTRRTLLWRAAEDGTPLCNACGIRYRRYRVRCQQCWNIPGKSRIPPSQCSRCGERCTPAGK